MAESMRLDRYLAQCGAGTRKEVKKLLRLGAVTVNGTTARDPGQKIEAGTDQVHCQGSLLAWHRYEYLMLHKPAGCVTALTDRRYPVVMSYLTEEHAAMDNASLPVCRDLSPVGRLDLDTEGLLLITNDGALSHRLLSPEKHVSKVYEATIDGPLTGEDMQAFAQGIDIGDPKPTRPAVLEILSTVQIAEETRCKVRLTITEGRFHQVKRMFEARGRKVLYLKRTAMGPLRLDPALKAGQWRWLTEEETDLLMNGTEPDR